MAGSSVKPKKSLPTTPLTPLKTYLIIYNVVSALGWGYVFVLTLTHLFNLDGGLETEKTSTSVLSRLMSSLDGKFGTSSIDSQPPAFLQPVFRRTSTTFSRVGATTAFVQSFAVLEVVHVLLGWVRSPLQTTVMQVASRLFLVWGIAEQFPKVRSNPLYTSMVLAWSITEIIRYSFYATSILGKNPYALLWLRYTSFYILYPLGAGSEAFLIYATLPSSWAFLIYAMPSSPIRDWASWLQGTWKPTDYARGVLFLIWWPGLYVMYTYMMSQRRKVLGRSGEEKKLKTK